MNRKRWIKFLVAGAAIIIWAGTVSSGFGFLIPSREGPVGEKHRPIVESIAAQNEIGSGNLWKIYVRASDPDGDLDKIQIMFSQLGSGIYSPELLVQKTMLKTLNGVILIWARLSGGGATGDIQGEVDIRAEDRAGNMSEPKKLSFTVNIIGEKDTFVAPPGFNAANNLGQAVFPLLTDEGLVGLHDN